MLIVGRYIPGASAQNDGGGKINRPFVLMSQEPDILNHIIMNVPVNKFSSLRLPSQERSSPKWNLIDSQLIVDPEQAYFKQIECPCIESRLSDFFSKSEGIVHLLNKSKLYKKLICNIFNMFSCYIGNFNITMKKLKDKIYTKRTSVFDL